MCLPSFYHRSEVRAQGRNASSRIYARASSPGRPIEEKVCIFVSTIDYGQMLKLVV
jgi:hypothetical protein